MKGFITIKKSSGYRRAIRISTIKEVDEDGDKCTIYTKVGNGSINSRSIYVRTSQKFDEIMSLMEEAVAAPTKADK